MCMAGTCLGAGEGEAALSQAAGQSCFTDVPGPGTVTGGHRVFGPHSLLAGLEKLIPDQCKEIHTALQDLHQPSLLSEQCIFLLLYFLLSFHAFFFFFFNHGGGCFCLLFFFKKKNWCKDYVLLLKVLVLLGVHINLITLAI